MHEDLGLFKKFYDNLLEENNGRIRIWIATLNPDPTLSFYKKISLASLRKHKHCARKNFLLEVL